MSSPDYVFSWIHLSDIHFGHGNTGYKYNQRIVLEFMKRDIVDLVENRTVPAPHAIIVTGDIAFSGAAVQDWEYARAAEWLQGIAGEVDVRADRVFVIPGNHDVQLNADADGNVSRLRSELWEGADISAALSTPADRELLARRVANYQAFAREFAPANTEAGIQGDGLYWRYRLPVNDQFSILLVGMNTALLCTGKAGDHDRRHLQVGNQQFAELFLDGVEEDDFVIALSHHPFDWLKDGEDLRALLPRVSHLYLSGHEHKAEGWGLRRLDGAEIVWVASGAVHDDQNASHRQHGYSVCSLWRSRKGRLILRVWPRLWTGSGDFVTNYHLVKKGDFADQRTRFRMTPAKAGAASAPPAAGSGSSWVSTNEREVPELQFGVLTCGHRDGVPGAAGGDRADPGGRTTLLDQWVRESYQRLPDGLLAPEDRSFRIAGFSTVLCSDPRERLEEVLGRPPSALVLLRVDSGRCQECSAAVARVVDRAREIGVRVLVVWRAPTEVPSDLLHSAVRFDYLPSLAAFSAGSPAPDLAAEKHNFLGWVKEIGDAQPRHPAVGIGVLLLNPEGELLLTRRRKSPEPQTYGTFGGPLGIRRNIAAELRRYAERELRLSGDDIDIGPLLCYSDVHDGLRHYVDLSFLAVADRSIRPIINDANHEWIGYRGEEPVYWFTFGEVMEFYAQDMLFTPVKTAFERLCILCLSTFATRGLLSRTERNPLEAISLTLELDGLRRRITNLPSAREIMRFLSQEKIQVNDPPAVVAGGAP
ncbi:MAG TPA: metallophosphoesterase [Longimicrobium sp.]|jgi:ADP-ribose pyrophosphatase YjhB (NUDIX family)